MLEAGDKIHIAASHKEIEKFFRLTNSMRSQAKNVMICGGGRVAYYLARQLLAIGMHVKIVEQNEARCLELSELLPKATIIHGNATQHELLEEEEIEKADAFVALTGMDEENIIMSMYAKMRACPNRHEGQRRRAGKYGGAAGHGERGFRQKRHGQSDHRLCARHEEFHGKRQRGDRLQAGGRKDRGLGFVIREKTRYSGIPLKDLTLKENHWWPVS